MPQNLPNNLWILCIYYAEKALEMGLENLIVDG
jgi:1,4-dihydroxy-2-naphthoyl-CoA synthase